MDLGIAGRAALVVAGSRGFGPGHRRGAGRRRGATDAVLAQRGQAGRGGVRHAVRRCRGGHPAGDITDPDTPARLVEATVEAFGAIDIVIANAGGPPPGRALDLDDVQLEAALNANLLSAIRLTREAVPHMRSGGWGRLCYITSYSVVQPLPALALSNTARTGLWAWVKTAAQDTAAEGSGITMNLLCPGPHATDRMKELGRDRADGRPGRLRQHRRVSLLRAGPVCQRRRTGGGRRPRPWRSRRTGLGAPSLGREDLPRWPTEPSTRRGRRSQRPPGPGRSVRSASRPPGGGGCTSGGRDPGPGVADGGGGGRWRRWGARCRPHRRGPIRGRRRASTHGGDRDRRRAPAQGVRRKRCRTPTEPTGAGGAVAARLAALARLGAAKEGANGRSADVVARRCARPGVTEPWP